MAPDPTAEAPEPPDITAAPARTAARWAVFWSGPLLAALGVAADGAITSAMVALGPLVGSFAPQIPPDALSVAGVTAWMAIWWIGEPVAIAATSMLPLLMFPVLGIVPISEVAGPYMHPLIVLLMAGFMAALAIERWGLHRRVALRVLLGVGTSPSRLVLGMMIACAVSSMWISNTATTLMMLPIAVALIRRGEDALGADSPVIRNFAAALLLGMAYGASVGGLGTPIGTPPNLIFMAQIEASFPDAPPITFVDFMMFGLPVVVIMIPIIWWYLTRRAHPLPPTLPLGSREVLRAHLRDLGRMGRDEKAVAAVFGTMALLWITRKVKVGGGEVLGWAPALGIDAYVDDATVAVLGALLLFVLPSKGRPGERLLDWATASRIPWDVMLLFGGGVSLAVAFKTSGLSAGIASGLAGLTGLPAVGLVLTIALTVTFLTEVTSNTATTNILMPILAAFAIASGLPPVLVMLPAALSASCAFMLPVATAPNAIVYGTGRIRIAQMARAGFAMNLVGAVVITTLVMLYR